MDDTTIVNNLTDTLSVSITKCEMALDTIGSNVNIDSCYSILKEIFDLQLQQNNETLIGMSLPIASIIVPAAMTLFVFGLGLLLDKIIKQKRKKKKYKNNSKAIKAYIEAVDKPIVDLTVQIRSYMSKCSKSKSIILNNIDIDNVNIECLKHFSIEELTLIYVTNRVGDINEKSKQLHNVISSIDYLSSATKEIRKCHEENQKITYDLLYQWNSNISTMARYSNQWVNSGTNGDIVQQISYLLRNQQTNRWETGDWYEKVYSPMSDWCAFNLKDKQSANLYPYQEALSNICQAYTQRIAIFDGVRKKMGEYADNIDKAYATLKENIKTLDKNNFVNLKEIE